MKASTTVRTCLTIWGVALPALLLSACNAPEPSEPEAEEAGAPVDLDPLPPEESDVGSTSILRSDMDGRPIADPPLEPLEATVKFEEGGSELSDAARMKIQEVVESEQFGEGGPIVLRGHSDASGSDDANLRASKRRAEAVRDLLEDLGANTDRIKIIAMGEQNPVEPNALPSGEPNEQGRAANRRVDITVELPAEKKAQEPASRPGPRTLPLHRKLPTVRLHRCNLPIADGTDARLRTRCLTCSLAANF